MSVSIQRPRQQWFVTDIYVGQRGTPGENGLVSLKKPGQAISFRRTFIRLSGLVPLHPMIERQARWCSQLEGQKFKIVSHHQDSVLHWLDLQHDQLGLELRCYLVPTDNERPSEK